MFQAKPEFGTALSLAQRREELAASQRAAKRAAREKEYEKYADDMKNFDISGYDRSYYKDLALAAAKKKEVMMTLNQEGAYANKWNDPRYIKVDNELNDLINRASQGTKNLEDIKSTIANPAQQDKIILNEEVNKAYAEGLKTDDFTEYWEKVKGIPTASQFYTPKIEEVDLDKDFRLNVMPILKQAKEGGQVSYTTPSGTVITKRYTELTTDEAEKITADRLLSEPIDIAANKAYSRLTKEEQAKYKDYKEWYIKSKSALFTGKETFEKVTGAGGGLSISLGKVNTGLYEFTETETSTVVPIIQDKNSVLPQGLSLKEVPLQAIDVTQVGGETAGRKFKITQPDVPGYKIDTDPQYLFKAKDKWYIVTRGTRFKVTQKMIEKNPDANLTLGELITDSEKDFVIPYSEYEDQFKTWSAKKPGQGFDMKQWEKTKTEEEPKEKPKTKTEDPLGIF